MLFNTNIQRQVLYLHKNDRHKYNMQTIMNTSNVNFMRH